VGQFKPGHTKCGGRKKGTPNKESLHAKEIAERLNCDLFEILCHFAMGNAKALKLKKDSISPGMRLAAAMEGAQYIHPKRKAIEHSGDVGLTLTDIIDALGD
jgi:hypothetical protein